MFLKVKDEWYEVRVREDVLEAVDPNDLDPEYVKKQLSNPRRLKPENKKNVNAKSRGSRRGRDLSSEKNVIAAYTHGMQPSFNKQAYTSAKSAWSTAKSSAKSKLKALVNDLQQGRVTKKEFLSRGEALLKGSYETAYRLGSDAGGMRGYKLPKEDLRWLKRASQTDMKYLRRFADDIVAKKGYMDYGERASMYIDTIDGTFEAGRVDAYPLDGTLVYWELSASENCGDCIALAMGSPYKQRDLPTTPRAGGTMCLSNCNCELTVRYDPQVNANVEVRPVGSELRARLARALGLGALGGKKGKQLPTFSGQDAEDDWDYEYEALEVLDWNLLDAMVSASATLKLLESTAPSGYKVAETRNATNKFLEAGKELPVWLDPFSREVYAWHALGAEILMNAHVGGGGDTTR